MALKVKAAEKKIKLDKDPASPFTTGAVLIVLYMYLTTLLIHTP